MPRRIKTIPRYCLFELFEDFEGYGSKINVVRTVRALTVGMNLLAAAELREK